MSEVVSFTRYTQKCDFCGEAFELQQGETLPAVMIPCDFADSLGKTGRQSIVRLSGCKMCLKKLNSLIKREWEIIDWDYAGVTVEPV